jgi:hypothetical protein
VTRVVITSSVAAIISPDKKSFDESDWNEFSIKSVEEKGKEADGGHKYRASKTVGPAPSSLIFVLSARRIGFNSMSSPWYCSPRLPA